MEYFTEHTTEYGPYKFYSKQTLKVEEHYKQEESHRGLQKKQLTQAKSSFKDDMKQETIPKIYTKRGEAWLILTAIHTDCAAEREISPIWFRKNILAMVGTISMMR